jgi:arsenate reductase
MEQKLKVLFLSTGDSTRGQMAEGFVRQIAGDRFTAMSAGIEGRDRNPLAAEVMREIGVDISGQQAKEVKQSLNEHFRYVVTLFDSAREKSPVFPFTPNMSRWSVKDPATEEGAWEQKKEAFRRVRDEIEAKVEGFLNEKAQEQRTAA